MDEISKTKMIEDIAEAHAYALAAYNKIDINTDDENLAKQRSYLSEIMHHCVAARSFADRLH